LIGYNWQPRGPAVGIPKPKVGVGQFQSITSDPQSLDRLLASRDYLLRIGAAYAYFADGDHRRLEPLLQGFPERMRHTSADLIILDHALRMATGRGAADDDASLRRINARALVPLFRWGVTLGVLVAKHYQLRGMHRTLSYLEDRLLPDNAWNAWIERR
jgi:hypothetical protein